MPSRLGGCIELEYHKKNRNDNYMTARPDLPDILFVCVSHTHGNHNEIVCRPATPSFPTSSENIIRISTSTSRTSRFDTNLYLHVTLHAHCTRRHGSLVPWNAVPLHFPDTVFSYRRSRRTPPRTACTPDPTAVPQRGLAAFHRSCLWIDRESKKETTGS